MAALRPTTRYVVVPAVIALAQQKGGVGKSTLAIHMAVEMTQRGLAVTILDLDPQGTVTKWRDRRAALLPNVIAISSAKLGEAVGGLKSGYDFIIIDLPGKSAPSVNEGLRLADLIIVPARPLDIDIEASFETIAAARRMGKRYTFAMTAAPTGGKRVADFADLLRGKGHPVLPAALAERMAYPDAIIEGLGVSEWEPNGKAAAEISVFTTAVLKEIRK